MLVDTLIWDFCYNEVYFRLKMEIGKLTHIEGWWIRKNISSEAPQFPRHVFLAEIISKMFKRRVFELCLNFICHSRRWVSLLKGQVPPCHMIGLQSKQGQWAEKIFLKVGYNTNYDKNHREIQVLRSEEVRIDDRYCGISIRIPIQGWDRGPHRMDTGVSGGISGTH